MQNQNRSLANFIFLGGISSDRGIKNLFKMWHKTNPRCILHIQSPNNEYKSKLLKSVTVRKLIRKKKVFFHEPVPEEAMVRSIAKHDVGVIPYLPTTKNNLFCCPNKFSQYQKAGLAIISHKLPYLENLIKKSEAGLCFNFKSANAFQKSTKKFLNQTFLKRCKKNSYAFYKQFFNWNNLSTKFYKDLNNLTRNQKSSYSHNIQIIKHPLHKFIYYLVQKLIK